MGRNFHLHGHILITVNGRLVHLYDAFPFETDLRSRLRTRTNLTYNPPVDGLHRRLSAKYRCGKRNGYGRVHIRPFSPESRFILHMHLKDQVARRTASAAGSSLTSKPDTLSGFDARRNMHLIGLHLSAAVLQPDHFLSSESRLIKCYIDIRIQIPAFCGKSAAKMAVMSAAVGSSAPEAIKTAAKSGLMETRLSETGTARTTAETSAMECASEQITEKIIHIYIAAIARMEVELPVTVSGILSVSIPSGAAAFAESGMTEPVIQLLLFFIAQNIVRF